MVIILDAFVVVQALDNGKVSAPCVRFSKGRYEGDNSMAPEVNIFGKQYLGTSHLQILANLPRKMNRTAAFLAEVNFPEDVPAVHRRILENSYLRLVSVEHLSKLDCMHIFPCQTLPALVSDHLSWKTGRIPAPDIMPPWYFLGWTRTARQWISQHLPASLTVSERDINLSLVFTWALGSTIRVSIGPEEQGRKCWYFKACPSRRPCQQWPLTDFDRNCRLATGVFGKEVCITEFMFSNIPILVPHIVAADKERGYILTEDEGVEIAHSGCNKTELDDFLQRVVRMQKWACGQVDELLEAGFGDRRLCKLTQNVREALEGTKVEGLPSLEPFYDDVERRCRLLEEDDFISATLVHGDIHAGNCVYKEGHVKLIDWSDGSVSHPIMEVCGMNSGVFKEIYKNAICMPKHVAEIGEPLALLDAFVTACRIQDSLGRERYLFGKSARLFLEEAVSILKEDKEC